MSANIFFLRILGAYYYIIYLLRFSGGGGTATLKEKIGCCSKLDGKYGIAFLIGCSSQFFVALVNRNSILTLWIG